MNRMKLQTVAVGLYFDGVNFWACRIIDDHSNVFKLTANGSLLSSFRLSEPGYAQGICKQADFFWLSIDDHGTSSIEGGYKVKPNGSVVASFESPYFFTPMYDCTFDGKYLWIATRTNRVCCCDVSNAPAVVPASVGRVKALFR